MGTRVNSAQFRLRGVDFSFPDGRRVLKGLDFDLHAGDRVGLTGSTGSGKTSLLHVLVGLLLPQTGSVEAFGAPCRSEADFRTVRRRAGLLFQDPDDQLFCPSVAEDVAFGPLNLGKNHAEAESIVTRVLESLGIAEYRNRINYRLSGGEKRLVSLAAVLAMEPDVLLLDEPTSGLDPMAAERLAQLLEKRHETLLVVSHDQAFLERLTRRHLCLREGRLHPA